MHSTLIKYNTEQFPLNTPTHIIYFILLMFLPCIPFILQMMKGSAGEIRSTSYHISLFPEYIKMRLSSSRHEFSKLSAASLLREHSNWTATLLGKRDREQSDCGKKPSMAISFFSSNSVFTYAPNSTLDLEYSVFLIGTSSLLQSV